MARHPGAGFEPEKLQQTTLAPPDVGNLIIRPPRDSTATKRKNGKSGSQPTKKRKPNLKQSALPPTFIERFKPRDIHRDSGAASHASSSSSSVGSKKRAHDASILRPPSSSASSSSAAPLHPLGRRIINPSQPVKGETACFTSSASQDENDSVAEFDPAREAARRKRNRVISPEKKGRLYVVPEQDFEGYGDKATPSSSLRRQSGKGRMPARSQLQVIPHDEYEAYEEEEEEEEEEKQDEEEEEEEHEQFVTVNYPQILACDSDDEEVYANLVPKAACSTFATVVGDDSGFVDGADEPAGESSLSAQNVKSRLLPSNLTSYARVVPEESHVERTSGNVPEMEEEEEEEEAAPEEANWPEMDQVIEETQLLSPHKILTASIFSQSLFSPTRSTVIFSREAAKAQNGQEVDQLPDDDQGANALEQLALYDVDGQYQEDEPTETLSGSVERYDTQGRRILAAETQFDSLVHRRAVEPLPVQYETSTNELSGYIEGFDGVIQDSQQDSQASPPLTHRLFLVQKQRALATLTSTPTVNEDLVDPASSPSPSATPVFLAAAKSMRRSESELLMPPPAITDRHAKPASRPAHSPTATRAPTPPSTLSDNPTVGSGALNSMDKGKKARVSEASKSGFASVRDSFAGEKIDPIQVRQTGITDYFPRAPFNSTCVEIGQTAVDDDEYEQLEAAARLFGNKSHAVVPGVVDPKGKGREEEEVPEEEEDEIESVEEGGARFPAIKSVEESLEQMTLAAAHLVAVEAPHQAGGVLYDEEKEIIYTSDAEEAYSTIPLLDDPWHLAQQSHHRPPSHFTPSPSPAPSSPLSSLPDSPLCYSRSSSPDPPLQISRPSISISDGTSTTTTSSSSSTTPRAEDYPSQFSTQMPESLVAFIDGYEEHGVEESL